MARRNCLSSLHGRCDARAREHNPLVTAGVRGGTATAPMSVALGIAALCVAGSLLVSGSDAPLSRVWAIPEAQAATAPGREQHLAASLPPTADAPEPVVAAQASLAHSRVLPWPMETVWPTAVRYLRVDRGYAIVDRDPEAGFVLFEFKLDRASADDDAPKGHGSLELFATTDSAGRPSAHVEVTVEGGAAHLPFSIVDGLHTKLREERGTPPPPPPKPKEPPKGQKKPRGLDPHGPPDDPGLDPTPDAPPDPEPPPKHKHKEKAPRLFE